MRWTDMSNFTLTLEPMAGSDFKGLVAEAKKKCQDLNLAYVHFTFNGISVSVGKRARVDNLSEVLQEAYSKDLKFVIIRNIN